jgi:hypothetical protein
VGRVRRRRKKKRRERDESGRDAAQGQGAMALPTADLVQYVSFGVCTERRCGGDGAGGGEGVRERGSAAQFVSVVFGGHDDVAGAAILVVILVVVVAGGADQQ